MIETCGGRYGAEGLRGLQGRVEPVLVLPGYRGAEDGLSTDGVRQDGGWRGVAGVEADKLGERRWPSSKPGLTFESYEPSTL